jgi:transglutaminase-like putative cysteine protease
MVTLQPATTDFAQRHAMRGSTTLQTVLAVGRALHDAMTFDPEATEVDTPLVDAFAARKGVCQDYAHILIACLRGLGVPAGYVSGFLRTTPPPGQPRLAGTDAMHAWVQVWVGGGLGWVEYDPTNDCLAAGDHVTVARGRDYADVAPITGVLRVSGGQRGRQAVDVTPMVA